MLSPTEEKMVEDYDRATADQIRREKESAEKPFKNTWLLNLLAAFENEAIESIKEMNSEIGMFLRCKETFKTRYMEDMSNYLITLAKYQIEEDYDDIARWRSYKKEISRV